ncbi:MAG: CoA transferase [Chloroflexota bacterium]|nr:CoA transferase [Chloroflexota bacterium]
MNEQNTLLSGCRVLDLTDEKGLFCGKVLGDFGADVIKIESPGGDAARNIGPFYKDMPDPEKSLFWFAANTSKRGITLDIESPDGKEIFERLVSSADIVVESFAPGYIDYVGLGYDDLVNIKADIVMTSITPFGQTGPYAHYQATDLIGAAMGGMARILGDLGRPPVRMGADPQSYFHAGLQGALGSVMAYYHKELTGQGQYVDVSMQDAVELTLMNAVEIFEILGANLMGLGQYFVSVRPGQAPLFTRTIVPCKDGYVTLMFGGGAFAGVAGSSKALVEWANSEGYALELKDFDFATMWDGSTITQEESNSRNASIDAFVLTKTKAELYAKAIEKGILLSPCATIEDVLVNAQLEARGFWEMVDHPELGESIKYPGAPVKMKETPWNIHRRAPLIGEHNEEIYESELGISREKMAILKANGVI